MFGFFKKTSKPAAGPRTQPNGQHMGVTQHLIPNMLTEHTSTFINAMTSPKANDVLVKAWNDMGDQLRLPARDRMAPDGLMVMPIRHEGYLCFVFGFPSAEAPSEASFGLAVLGPSADWKNDPRPILPFRYFLLVRGDAGADITSEWKPEGIEPLWQSQVEIPPDFVNPILAAFYGYEPNA